VVSGLLTSQAVSDSRTATVTQVDWFNSSQLLNWTSPDHAVDTISASFIELQHSYPLWTQDEFALAQVSILDTTSQEATSLTVTLPAMRANLSCRALVNDAAGGFNVSNWSASQPNYLATTTENMYNNIMVSVPIPAACQYLYQDNNGVSDPRDNGTANVLKLGFAIGYGEGKTGYFAGSFWPSFDVYAQYALNPPALNISTSCPGIVVVFGHVTNGTTDRAAVVTCSYATAQTVDVKASLLLPGYNISTTQPLQALKSTAKSISYMSYQASGLPSIISFPQAASLDAFVTAILVKSGSTSNFSRLFDGSFFATYTEQTYKALAAQQFNYNLRSSLISLGLPSSTLSGTLTFANRRRLVQNAMSTYILEAMLAILFICAVLLLFSTRKLRRLLPNNPCSIAVLATLLAGSKLLECDFFPEGATWMSDEEIKRSGALDRHSSALGWWDVGSEQEQEDSDELVQDDQSGVLGNSEHWHSR